MIRIDALWLCSQPQDMRAGADRLLTVVVNTLGEAHAHHGYLFANARASRLKLLVHDGFGVWCATWRMHAGRFVWRGRFVFAAICDGLESSTGVGCC
jgi:transposase